jgi:hypothetical protein
MLYNTLISYITRYITSNTIKHLENTLVVPAFKQWNTEVQEFVQLLHGRLNIYATYSIVYSK